MSRNARRTTSKSESIGDGDMEFVDISICSVTGQTWTEQISRFESVASLKVSFIAKMLFNALLLPSFCRLLLTKVMFSYYYCKILML